MARLKKPLRNESGKIPLWKMEFKKDLRRAIDTETGQSWFVAKEVADYLGLRIAEIWEVIDLDERCPLNALRDRENVHGTEQFVRFRKDTNMISESALYKLVFCLIHEDAEAFRNWLFTEVLPCISANGAYLTPSLAEQLIQDQVDGRAIARTIKAQREAKEKSSLHQIRSRDSKRNPWAIAEVDRWRLDFDAAYRKPWKNLK